MEDNDLKKTAHEEESGKTQIVHTNPVPEKENPEAHDLSRELKHWYFTFFSPSLLFLAGLLLMEKTGGLHYEIHLSKGVYILFIGLSVLFSLIIPIWMRIIFVNQMRGKLSSPYQTFVRFQKIFIILSSLSLDIVPIAYLVKTPKNPMIVIVFLAIYAAYFYFPSKERLHMEKRIFRVDKIAPDTESPLF